MTLSAALDTGQVTPETVFDVGPPRRDDKGPYYVYEVDGGIVFDRNHTEQVLNLERAYVTSANAVFGRIGAEMPPRLLWSTRLVLVSVALMMPPHPWRLKPAPRR